MGPKDLGNQQSRFKWMMEGQTSPDTASPDNAFHKNGWLPFSLGKLCSVHQGKTAYLSRVSIGFSMKSQ